MRRMIEESRNGSTPRCLARHLMVGGLGFWSIAIGGAFVPRVLRAALFPADAVDSHLDLVAAQPVGAFLFWTSLVAWCVSWACVAGYLTTDWARRRGRPSWASPALWVSSLASPFVFAFAFSVLVRLATNDASHGGGAVRFLPAVVLQLVLVVGYTLMTGFRSDAEPAPAELASP